MSENPETQGEKIHQERAEQLVDQAGERLGHLTASLSRRLHVMIALAREEAEDIVAEAQSLRGSERR